jgi:hypothetical protein
MTTSDTARATETFAAQIGDRVFYVRTGDLLAIDHPVVAVHPTRFDHRVEASPDPQLRGS